MILALTVMVSLIASAIVANVWLVRQLEKDLSEWNRTFQEGLLGWMKHGNRSKKRPPQWTKFEDLTSG